MAEWKCSVSSASLLFLEDLSSRDIPTSVPWTEDVPEFVCLLPSARMGLRQTLLHALCSPGLS